MNKLKFCQECKKYTLKSSCSECSQETKQAGYKYIRVQKEKS